MRLNRNFSLYLDDERNPKTARSWTVVRDYDDFVSAVTTRGFPAVISFDHDLGEDSPSGMACAKWLVDLGIDMGLDPNEIEWNVNSANPVGAENIRGLYKSWCRFMALPDDAP